HVVLADHGAMTGLRTRADNSAGVDHGAGADPAARTYHGRPLAGRGAAGRHADSGAGLDDGPFTKLNAGVDHGTVSDLVLHWANLAVERDRALSPIGHLRTIQTRPNTCVSGTISPTPGGVRPGPAPRGSRTARPAWRRRPCRSTRSAPARTRDRGAATPRAPRVTTCTTSAGRGRPRPT